MLGVLVRREFDERLILRLKEMEIVRWFWVTGSSREHSKIKRHHLWMCYWYLLARWRFLTLCANIYFCFMYLLAYF